MLLTPQLRHTESEDINTASGKKSYRHNIYSVGFWEGPLNVGGCQIKPAGACDSLQAGRDGRQRNVSAVSSEFWFD